MVKSEWGRGEKDKMSGEAGGHGATVGAVVKMVGAVEPMQREGEGETAMRPAHSTSSTHEWAFVAEAEWELD